MPIVNIQRILGHLMWPSLGVFGLAFDRLIDGIETAVAPALAATAAAAPESTLHGGLAQTPPILLFRP